VIQKQFQAILNNICSKKQGSLGKQASKQALLLIMKDGEDMLSFIFICKNKRTV